MFNKIKVDHALAQHLWATGNHDGRVLATMIADPSQADDALLEGWVGDLSNYVLTDAVTAYVARTPHVREKVERWTRSSDEWIGSAGWGFLASLALRDAALPDAYFAPYLANIERDIHGSKNRVRHAMNNALLAIGLRNASLREKALAAAGRIGEVVVDHGETGCKNPGRGRLHPESRGPPALIVPGVRLPSAGRAAAPSVGRLHRTLPVGAKQDR